ncbi:5559_t:CDS:2, partial [Dentiscutata heterogama]
NISKIGVNDLSCDDPLINGVIDLGSDRYQSVEDDLAVLLGEKNSIKRLGKDASIRKVCSEFVANRDSFFQQLYRLVLLHSEEVVHDRWVEQESAREVVMKDITDVLLQKIKSKVLSKVTYGSENTLVEAVAHLIEASLHRLPIEYEVEVTRNERQSNKQKEIVYIESGKWNCNDKKRRENHNKLVKLCLCGYEEMGKKAIKDQLHRHYIAFGINIAGDRFILHGLLNENGIKYYCPIAEAIIPFHNESIDN